MAQHEHCDPDQARWIGVRPGIDGDEIYATASANNSTVAVYTVPANKRFYLFNAGVSVRSVTPAVGDASFYLDNGLGVVIWRFGRAMILTGDSKLYNYSFYMPMIIPATYRLIISSFVAGIIIEGSIHGVLVDV
jgi:hypothetical protein